jgi:hypothetical protein
MRFIIDAALPQSLTKILRDGGYDAIHVADIGMAHAPDDNIAAYAKRNGLAILTQDFDFADIRHYPPREYHGIVVFTFPKPAGLGVIQTFTRRFLERLPPLGELRGQLVIVDDQKIRTRN